MRCFSFLGTRLYNQIEYFCEPEGVVVVKKNMFAEIDRDLIFQVIIYQAHPS